MRQEGLGAWCQRAECGCSVPLCHPVPLSPQVVRAKERLDEELRIRAKDEKEKGWKAET